MSYYNASAGNFGKNWTRALQRVVILGVCWCYEAETVIPLDKKGDMEEVEWVFVRAISSADRAQASGAWCRRFDSGIAFHIKQPGYKFQGLFPSAYFSVQPCILDLAE